MTRAKTRGPLARFLCRCPLNEHCTLIRDLRDLRSAQFYGEFVESSQATLGGAPREAQRPTFVGPKEYKKTVRHAQRSTALHVCPRRAQRRTDPLNRPLHARTTTAMADATTYLGITPPMDASDGAPGDETSSEALVTVLKALGVYESEEGSRRRSSLIDDVAAECQSWCREEWLLQGNDAESAPKCELRTFGSVRLEVHAPDADVDVVLVAPRHCTRTAFFDRLVKRLEARDDVGVGRVMPVRDAYTPVLKFRMASTDVDLLFAPLAVEKLPEPLDIMDDALLRGLDDVSVRSLNGARVAEQLLGLVPDASVFRVALRAIKKWARCKGLYSNVLGLLGGINCAILVAFVCQRYPLSHPAVVVEKFFRLMETWQWPNPIMLTPPSADDARAWNPRCGRRVVQGCLRLDMVDGVAVESTRTGRHRERAATPRPRATTQAQPARPRPLGPHRDAGPPLHELELQHRRAAAESY